MKGQMIAEYQAEYAKSLADKRHLLSFYDPNDPNDREMLEIINADIEYLGGKIAEINENENGWMSTRRYL